MGGIIGEQWVKGAVFLAVRLVEAAGVIVILAGAFTGFAGFAKAVFLKRESPGFTQVRLTIGQFLALGLEFQLASDLLRTAISPSFEDIGKLAAVATIRTALNFFLSRESQEQRAELARDERSPP